MNAPWWDWDAWGVWEVRMEKEGYSLAGEDKSVNRVHYLRSTLSMSLSPLGGDREGRSYLRKADNPEDPQSGDPHCSAPRTDSKFTPPHTPSHLSFFFQCGRAQTQWKSIPDYIFTYMYIFHVLKVWSLSCLNSKLSVLSHTDVICDIWKYRWFGWIMINSVDHWRSPVIIVTLSVLSDSWMTS